MDVVGSHDGFHRYLAIDAGERLPVSVRHRHAFHEGMHDVAAQQRDVPRTGVFVYAIGVGAIEGVHDDFECEGVVIIVDDERLGGPFAEEGEVAPGSRLLAQDTKSIMQFSELDVLALHVPVEAQDPELLATAVLDDARTFATEARQVALGGGRQVLLRVRHPEVELTVIQSALEFEGDEAVRMHLFEGEEAVQDAGGDPRRDQLVSSDFEPTLIVGFDALGESEGQCRRP